MGFSFYLGIVLVLAEITAIYYGIKDLIDYREFLKNPTIEAEVTHSKMYRTSSKSGDRGGTNISYNVDLEYKFSIKDKEYTGDGKKNLLSFSKADTAKNIINKYKVGSKIPVLYDPENPMKNIPNIHVKSSETGTIIILVFGVIFLIGTWYFMIQMEIEEYLYQKRKSN